MHHQALARNPVTGVLHAFVEARRSTNAPGVGCEDLPDTHLAWKRSLDGGSTWSPLKILARADNLTRAQPTPVIDCKTGMVHMTFANWKRVRNHQLMTSSRTECALRGHADWLACCSLFLRAQQPTRELSMQ